MDERVTAEERAQHQYGEGTVLAVAAYCADRGLDVPHPGLGIDVETAERINGELIRIGALFVAFGPIVGVEGELRGGSLVFGFDTDFVGRAQLGETSTTGDRTYRLLYDPRFYTEPGPGHEEPKEPLELVISVYADDGRELARSDVKTDPSDNEEMPLKAENVVRDGKPVGEGNGAVNVRCTTLSLDGSPVAAVTVRVLTRTLRSDAVLHEGLTDTDGRLTTTIQRDRLTVDGYPVALVVQTLTGDGDVHDEVTIIDVPDVVDVTLSSAVGTGMPQIEHIGESLRPLLGDLRLDSLDADRLTLLSASARVAPAAVVQLAVAQRLAADTGLDHAVSFGCIRAGLSADADALLAHDDDTILGALDAAREVGDVRDVPTHDEVKDALRQARSVRALRRGPGRVAALDDLLAPHLAEAEKRMEFVALALKLPDDAETFWEHVRSDLDLGDAAVEGLQETLRVAAITGGDTEVLRAVARRHDGNMPASAALAALSEDDWAQTLIDAEVGAPSGLAGHDDPVGAYARVLADRVQQEYPVEVFSDRVRRSNFAERDVLLEALAGMEPDALASPLPPTGDLEQSRAPIAALKRVATVARSASDTVTLLANGFVNARGIAAIDRQHFIGSYQVNLKQSAASVHDRASRVSAQVLGVMARYGDDFHMSMAAIPKVGENGIPNWKDLFGGIDLCACDECRSIDGPAAYMVDILALLRAVPNAMAELQARRGDILDLELSCRNTNTALPYIDLVCEILEDGVAPAGADPDVPIASTRSSADLIAGPQRRNADAYTVLAEAKFPWSLPYDLPWSTARVFLAHLGVGRNQLIGRFTPIPDETLFAAEELGLGPGDIARLAEGIPADLAAQWGVTPPAAGDWFEPLAADLGQFLRSARLEFDELQNVLASKFLNPDPEVTLDPPHACSVDEYALTGVTEAFLDRLRRFQRLRIRLGWSVTDLEAVVYALNPAEITPASLVVDLAVIARLGKRLRLDLEILATFWRDIRPVALDAEAQGLWQSIFDAPAVRAAESGSTPFTIDDAGVLTGGGSIADHASGVQAAVGISSEDLAALLHDDPGAAFSIPELSRIHRYARLARALRVSIPELLTLQKLRGGDDPFAGPGSTERFVTALDGLRDNNLTPQAAALMVGLRDETEVERTARITRQSVLLTTIRDGAAAILAAVTPIADDDGLAVDAELAKLISDDDRAAVMGMLARTDALSDDDRRQVVQTALGHLLDPKRLADNLIGPTAPTAASERYAYLLGAMIARDQARQFVTLQLASASGTEIGAVGALARAIKPVGEADLVSALTAPGFVSTVGVVTAAVHAEIFSCVTRLERAIVALSPYALSEPTVTFLLRHATAGGWLSPTDFPAVTDAAAAPQRYGKWVVLARLLDLARRVGHAQALFDGIETALLATAEQDPEDVRSAVFDRLADIPKWSAEDIAAVAGAQALNVTLPQLQSIDTYERLADAMETVRRLGVSADVICDPATPWVAPVVSADASERIRHAAAARHTPEEWASIARPLQDELRIGQRDALVDYLCHTRDMDANALFGHYLIDVEMSPCQLTSRIKQAISSLQLLIQRGQLQMEPNVQLSDAQSDVWNRWMHSFRIWQANRRVFLYPERWIAPELRDDKTPTFIALENALQQGELTESAVDEAFRGYVDELHHLGNLEIIGSHLEYGDDSSTTLHLFGRTRGNPHALYYRTFRNWREWTPWESVPVEVTTNQVAPTVFNSRLYLFWLIPERKAKEKVAEAEAPEYYWEITLAWSERRNGVWTSKRLSTSKAQSGFMAFQPDAATGFGITIDQVGTATGDANNPGLSGWVPGHRNGNLLFAPGLVRAARQLSIQCVALSPLMTFGDVQWVCRWRMGGCEDEPKVVQTPPPTPKPFYYPLGSWFEAGHISGGDDAPVRVVENGSATVSGTPVEVALLNDSPKGGRITLRADHERYPFASGFFFSDPAHAYLVRAVRTFPVMTQKLVTAHSAVTQMAVTRGVSLLNEQALLPAHAGPGRGWALVGEDAAKPAGHRAVAAQRINAATMIGNAPGTFTALKKSSTAATSISVDDMRAVVQWGLADAEPSDEPLTVLLPPWTYEFTALHHPWTCEFVRTLKEDGPFGLVTLTAQYPSPTKTFADRYDPTNRVRTPYPDEDLDFGEGGVLAGAGPWAQYNWELFFHIPMKLAISLADAGQFAAARKWFHTAFNPTIGPVTHPRTNAKIADWQRTWRFRPFFEATDPVRSVEFLQALLHISPVTPALKAQRQAFLDSIDAWRADPFKPHLIARFRPAAYQRWVVYHYISMCIAQGDALFADDTMESINEATQYYVLAAELLGERPTPLRAKPDAQHKSFRDLEPTLDAFSNALDTIEGAIADSDDANDTAQPGDPDVSAVRSVIGSLYFCTPPNSDLLNLWDTVADRLYKVRHCQNLQGVERELPLFEPPIDPSLLVAAAAAGLSLDGVEAGMGAALPNYRCTVMTARANDLCGSVRALGAALQTALEKRDAERLMRLRSTHERALLDKVKVTRTKQIEEAEAAITSIEAARKSIEERINYFGTRQRVSGAEKSAHDALIVASALRTAQGLARMLASVMNASPNFTVGTSGSMGSPVVTITAGGSSAAGVAGGVAEALGAAAEVAGIFANKASFNAVNDRRWDDWQHQLRLAQAEAAQLDKQLIGAKLRRDIATTELVNLEQQQEAAEAVDEYLRTKFTNVELFDWTVSQVSAIYFQAFQLAKTTAKQAMKCFQWELATTDNFIAANYWDSAHRGLLAGERLQGDIDRLKAEWLNRNVREHELVKTVSLVTRDPVAFEQLRSTGHCEVRLPEWFYDMDHPGHYMRRLRSLSLTVPAVVGPYTSVNARITLGNSQIRRSPDLRDGVYAAAEDVAADDRIAIIPGTGQHIVTSRAQGDAGLFERSLHDERYLPFEGAGAVCTLEIDIDPDCNDFPMDSISDCLIEVMYTARDGGEQLRQACKAEVVQHRPTEAVGPLVRMVSARAELSDAWHSFMYPATNTPGQELAIDVPLQRFPFRARQGPIEISDVRIALALADETAHHFPDDGLPVTVIKPDGTEADVPNDVLKVGADPALLKHPGAHIVLGAAVAEPGRWVIKIDQDAVDALPAALTVAPATPGQPRRLKPDTVADVLVFFTYTMLPRP